MSRLLGLFGLYTMPSLVLSFVPTARRQAKEPMTHALHLLPVLDFSSRKSRTSRTAGLRSTGVTPEIQSDSDTESHQLSAAQQEKAKLLGLLRVLPAEEPVLCDPITKEGLVVTAQSSPWLGSDGLRKTSFTLKSASNTYAGSSDAFLNLLEPVDTKSSSTSSSGKEGTTLLLDRLIKSATPFVPPPLRSALATAGLPMGSEYVPMRDLFTSPSVSFAYERGWRQNFATAGFPGPDREAEMAIEYFELPMQMAKSNGNATTLVDMSCATGLFTRRFAKSGKYDRVLGCDYSESMLEEARRRIERDSRLRSANRRTYGTNPATRLDLVRLDVGRIPMKNNSIDAMNAGAAMHCWPDLPTAASEIYRVLKPGGRYFATTFLSSWFGVLQHEEGGAAGPSRQAFQYFASVDQLRDLMEAGGFRRDKILVEILGRACVVIRCEK
jgi:ubiquinone/menaquinone biosynthesis C-methylase UbiE